MTRLIMIRHAETEANLAKLWYGALDAPLTERGKGQVAAVAARMAQMRNIHPIDRFYVSPLGRARTTAAGIAAAIGMQPVIDDGLREFSLGDWEGRSIADLRKNEQLWDIWRDDSHFAPPNGESPASFHARTVETVERLAGTHPGETVLVVAHGGIIGNVLALWFGNGIQEWGKYAPHNCSVSTIEKGESGWSAPMVNDIAHLPDELRRDETPSSEK